MVAAVPNTTLNVGFAIAPPPTYMFPPKGRPPSNTLLYQTSVLRPCLPMGQPSLYARPLHCTILPAYPASQKMLKHRIPNSTNISSHCPKISSLVHSNTEGPVDLSLRKRAHTTLQNPTSEPVKSVVQSMAPQVGATSQEKGETVREGTYVQCRYCPFKSHTIKLMRSHITESHPQNLLIVPKSFTCNYCNYVTSSELCMVRHLLTQHRPMILPSQSRENASTSSQFSCSVCIFSADETTMINHMLDHYKTSSPCNSCTSCLNWTHPSPSKPKRTANVKRRRRVASAGTRKARSNTQIEIQSKSEAQSNVAENHKSAVEENLCNICHTLHLTAQDLLNHQKLHSAPFQIGDNLVVTKMANAIPMDTAISTSNTVSQAIATSPPDVVTDCVEPLTVSLPTPPSSECDVLAVECSTLYVLPDQQSATVCNDIASNTPLQSASSNEKSNIPNPSIVHSIFGHSQSLSGDISADHTLLLTECDTQTALSETMPTVNLKPSKRRKLALKSRRDRSGEYEPQQHGEFVSPTITPNAKNRNAKTLKLCVQVPLEVLSSRPNLTTPSKSDSENIIQSPTKVQIPFAYLPKGAIKRCESNEKNSTKSQRSLPVLSTNTELFEVDKTVLDPVLEERQQSSTNLVQSALTLPESTEFDFPEVEHRSTTANILIDPETTYIQGGINEGE